MIKILPFIFILLWSSAFITTKPLIDNGDPFTALALRFFIVSLGFYFFSILTKQFLRNRSFGGPSVDRQQRRKKRHLIEAAPGRLDQMPRTSVQVGDLPPTRYREIWGAAHQPKLFETIRSFLEKIEQRLDSK